MYTDLRGFSLGILLKRILALCEMRGIGISKLEKLSDLSQNSINKWDRSIPSGDKIQKVADYFDVSIDYLMGRTDNMDSHKNPETFSYERELKNLMEIKTIVDQKIEDAKTSKGLS